MGGNVHAINQNRLEICTLSRNNIEGELAGTKHFIGSRHHRTGTLIINHYGIPITFEPCLNVVIFPNLSHSIMHLISDQLPLFSRNIVSIYPHRINVIARNRNNVHTQRITAQNGSRRRMQRTTFTAKNSTSIFNTFKLRRHGLVGSQRMNRQLRITLVELQRIKAIHPVHRHRSNFIAIVRNELYANISTITRNNAVGHSSTPLVSCRNYLVIIEFRKNRNRMISMEVFKNIMIGSREEFSIHLQSRYIVALLRCEP